MTVVQQDRDLRVVANDLPLMRLRLEEQSKYLKMLAVPDDPQLALRAVSGAAEAMFGWRPSLDRLVLDAAGREILASELLNHGLAVMIGDDLTLVPELAMQRRDNWLVDAMRPPLPQLYVMTDGKRHPRRAPKPSGLVYARFIPWLAETISFRVANLDDHLHLLHR
ncbi:hypothetical protein [Bradyrhizobium cenepequi]